MEELEYDFDLPSVPSSPPSTPRPPPSTPRPPPSSPIPSPSDGPDLEWCLRRTHDVALIYADDDEEDAFRILEEMTDGTKLDVRLQTDECFGANIVERPGIIASQCWLVLVVHTSRTTNDMVANFIKDELIAQIRITEGMDYIRPLCTEKRLQPLSGLASMDVLFWDLSAKQITKKRVKSIIEWKKNQDLTRRIENLKLAAPMKLCDPKDVKPSSDLQVYDMSGSQKGILLIINNYDFTDSEKYCKRDSSCKDAESLKKLFENFGFSVETVENLTAKGIKKEIVKHVEASEAGDYCCLATAILSHGSNGGVVGTDGDFVSFKEIADIFKEERWRCHLDKPKLFFVQACQQGPTLFAEITGKPNKLNREGHYYWALPTVPGYGALRDPEDGSYFIQCLVDVFKKYAYKYALGQLMTKVKFDVEQITFHKDDTSCSQVCVSTTTLQKELFFYPGITGDI